MKTIKLLTVIILILVTSMFPQNLWKNEVTLNFTVQSNTKVNSYVDGSGIHIVYSRNGGIRYALANSQGTVIKYDKVVVSESSGADFANVVAINNDVYIIYYKDNDIKVAKSTNLGDSWNASFESYDLINTDCNKIVAYRYNNDIYITWQKKELNL